MLLLGIGLVVLALAGFWLALPANGISKFRRSWVEQVVVLAIVCSGMTGVVLALAGTTGG